MDVVKTVRAIRPLFLYVVDLKLTIRWYPNEVVSEAHWIYQDLILHFRLDRAQIDSDNLFLGQ